MSHDAPLFSNTLICHYHELGQRRFTGSEARSDHESQIRHYEKDRYGRADSERQVNRNVIDEISQQQMEGKESRGEEEVIHRMEFDAAQGCDDEHQKEKEEE